MTKLRIPVCKYILLFLALLLLSGCAILTPKAKPDYTVEVTDTNVVLGSMTATQSDGSVTVASSETYVDADFGFTPSAANGSIGDLVYHDVLGNGVFDGAQSSCP